MKNAGPFRLAAVTSSGGCAATFPSRGRLFVIGSPIVDPSTRANALAQDDMFSSLSCHSERSERSERSRRIYSLPLEGKVGPKDPDEVRRRHSSRKKASLPKMDKSGSERSKNGLETRFVQNVQGSRPKP